MAQNLEDAVIGCLLGTAVGDALGLPCEGLTPRRQARLFPQLSGYHFFLRKGMVSDDTEHLCMVAQALLVSAGEERAFLRSLAWRLRFWLLGLPAGIGWATLRAILKLWLGFSGRHSGVFSAGNGPAMRSAILGVCYGHDPAQLRQLVRASTRLTHTDPKAEFGALAVALAAHLSASCSPPDRLPEQFLESVKATLGPEAKTFLGLIEKAVQSVTARQTTEAFAVSLGLKRGVSGYVYHTVPVVVHAWLSFPGDFLSAVQAVIRCGGDADTTSAILGGIVGAGVGKAGIPPDLLRGLWAWPRTVSWMEQLGKRLAQGCGQGRRQPALRLPLWGIVVRNLFFFLVVLLHGFRRLLPPY
jgi:ADP-ribosylglycohydrolase